MKENISEFLVIGEIAKEGRKRLMQLAGIINKEKFINRSGIHQGIPYRIVEERDKFLLEKLSIKNGLGLCGVPVGFFSKDWEGIYVENQDKKGKEKKNKWKMKKNKSF